MVDKNVKISIITPVYNADKYLEECLASLINQSLENIEIFCIDDNSKDSSLTILKDFAKKDERIKIIHFEERQGQGYARNAGMKKAKGKYIGFVDADDFVDLNMFEKMYERAELQNADITMCQGLVYDDKIKNVIEDDKYYSLACFEEKFEKKYFNHHDTIDFWDKINVAVWNKLYRRDFLINTGAKFPEGFIYEDLPFFYNTYTKAKRSALVKEFLYYYRINSQNSTMTRTDKNVKDRVDMAALTYEILKKQTYFKDIKAKVIDWLIHDLFYRCLIIDSRYQKEYFFRMKKFFKTIDTSDVEDSLLKSPYYPHFCEIKKRNYDDCLKYFFNQETFAAAYIERAKKIFDKESKALGERQQMLLKLEEENLQKKYDLENLQEKILNDEKEHWVDLETEKRKHDIEYQKQKDELNQAWQSFEKEKKNNFQKLDDAWGKFNDESSERKKQLDNLQDKILSTEKELWNRYNTSKNKLEDESKRQKNNNKLALARAKNILSNKFFEESEKERQKLSKEYILELEKERESYSDMLKKQLDIQQKNYEKINSFKKKIKETKMKRPKVSVILPVYNVAPYLRQSLDSIISQTLTDIEIICVDDGSTDESGKILDEYNEKDGRIKVIHKKNAGTGAARNDGLKIATGECIGFVDPDDWILPNMYERLYNLLQEKELDIVMFTPDVFNDKTKKHEGFLYFQNSNFPDFLDNKIFNKDDISPFSYPMCVWNKLYTKKLFDENNIEFAEGLDFEDHKVIFKSLFTAKRIYFIREKLYVYRHSREGSILSDNDTRMFDHIKIYDIVENILKETGNWEKFHLDFLRYKVHNILYYYTMIKPQYKKDYYNKMVKSLQTTKMNDEELEILSRDYPDLKPIMEKSFLNKIKKSVKNIIKYDKQP